MADAGDAVIPIATTSVSVLRKTDATLDGEPYGEVYETVVASHVRANITAPKVSRPGSEKRQGGAQMTRQYYLICDTPSTEINHNDVIIDEKTGKRYEVTSVNQRNGLGLDHTTAELKRVEGLT